MILLMQRALPTDKRGLFIGIDVKTGFTTGMHFPTCFDSSCVKMADGFHVTLYLFGNRSQMMYKCRKGIKVMQKAQLSLSVPLLTT